MSTVEEAKRAVAFDDDARLAKRIQEGDSDAFQALYRRYYDKVFSIARGVVLVPEEAADAVQEIFTVVYRKLDKFDRRSRFSTWLFRIAVNRSIQYARKQRHVKREVSLAPSHEVAVEGSFLSGDPAVMHAMSQLQPQDRAILVLFYWDELSLEEIGESLGCSANAAKTRLFRARERFRSSYLEATQT